MLLTAVVLIGVFLLWAPERMVSWAVSGQQATDRLTPEQYARLVDEYRKTLAQVLLGFGAVGTLYFTYCRSVVEQETLRATQENVRIAQLNLETTRDSKITERFAKAVEQLGAVDKDGRKLLEVRFGGIYGLERIARDSPNDHWTVMEILTAYVRENSPAAKTVENRTAPNGAEIPPLAKDIQAILTVIGRRKLEHEEEKIRSLDLSRTDLRKVNLVRAKLADANLAGADLAGANLAGVQLEGAYLEGANLAGVQLVSAKLRGAYLEGAFLRGANLLGANLADAKLGDADLGIAYLAGANLRDADLENAHLAYANLADTNLEGAIWRARI